MAIWTLMDELGGDARQVAGFGFADPTPIAGAGVSNQSAVVAGAGTAVGVSAVGVSAGGVMGGIFVPDNGESQAKEYVEVGIVGVGLAVLLLLLARVGGGK